MDYEKEYKEALERAKAGKPLDEVFPELKESEDERLRKLLVWQVHRNIEDETNDLAQSVYDGIKGHDPDLEESIEDWKKCLAYLEKQKEQRPVKLNDDTEVGLDRALQIVKAAKGNLCGYQSDDGIYECCHAIQTLENILKDGIEQKPAEWSDTDNIGWDEAFACVISAEKAAKNEEELQNAVTAEKWLTEIKFKYYVHPVNQEWSEEDERKYQCIRCILLTDIDKKVGSWKYSEILEWYEKRGIGRYTNSQPHWKPSEEKMKALDSAINYLTKHTCTPGNPLLISLYHDLQKLL